jgi:hypothetical protein
MNPLWVAGCATAGRIWNKRSGGQPGRLIADNVERMIVYLNRRVPLANGKGTALVSAMDYELVMQYHWFLQPADAIHRASYALRNLGRSPDGKHRTQKMHQLITGQKNVDHKNLDGLDNRRTNLRPAGPPDQAANHGKRADNTSGYIGVSWDKQYGKWRAQVRKNGKTVWSDRFDDLEKAARARDAKALEHYGEFAVLGQVPRQLAHGDPPQTKYRRDWPRCTV